MPTLNEVKDEMTVVQSVGEFTNALQQIATLRMVRLRQKVLASRPFVETAHTMLRELMSIKNALQTDDIAALEKKHAENKTLPASSRRAVIVVTSNQGLTGRYNIEIYQRVEQLLEQEKDADFYIIGKKGQEYFAVHKYPVEHFPYHVPDNFTIDDLQRLVKLFDYYLQVTLVYSRYLNSATREVVATSIVNPVPEVSSEDEKQPGKYTFEPDLYALIDGISHKLRGALFQQQIFDARLAQNSAQMIGMKTASDNANNLLADLRIQYNKQRRKMIDKKIGEVFAGSALW